MTESKESSVFLEHANTLALLTEGHRRKFQKKKANEVGQETESFPPINQYQWILRCPNPNHKRAWICANQIENKLRLFKWGSEELRKKKKKQATAK